jgi:hypothetical protein
MATGDTTTTRGSTATCGSKQKQILTRAS